MSTTQPPVDQQVYRRKSMAISVSSYEIIIPNSRHIVIVNAQPGEHVDNLLVINPSPTQAAMIQCYEDIQSVYLDDGGPAYTTLFMEFKTNNGSAVTPRFLDEYQVLDYETCMLIKSNIMKYESVRANGFSEAKIPEHYVKIGGNSKEEEEGEICVICQEEFQLGEMREELECKHQYHEECIEKWLQHKDVCPICRATVFLL